MGNTVESVDNMHESPPKPSAGFPFLMHDETVRVTKLGHGRWDTETTVQPCACSPSV